MKVGVEKVVEALHEDDDNAETDHSACHSGDYPVDRRCEARPAEPDTVSIHIRGWQGAGTGNFTRINHPQRQCHPRYMEVNATPV